MSLSKKLAWFQITICLVNVIMFIILVVGAVSALMHNVIGSVNGNDVPIKVNNSIKYILENGATAVFILIWVSAGLITIIGVIQLTISSKDPEGKTKKIVAGTMGLLATIPFAVTITFLANIVVVADRNI